MGLDPIAIIFIVVSEQKKYQVCTTQFMCIKPIRKRRLYR